MTIQIVEKTLRLAYQHAVHANSLHFNSFLVGTVETLAGEFIFKSLSKAVVYLRYKGTTDAVG